MNNIIKQKRGKLCTATAKAATKAATAATSQQVVSVFSHLYLDLLSTMVEAVVEGFTG